MSVTIEIDFSMFTEKEPVILAAQRVPCIGECVLIDDRVYKVHKVIHTTGSTSFEPPPAILFVTP